MEGLDEKLFSPQQLARIDLIRVPHHIAIIPDGNRRWAEQRMAMPQDGHKSGADSLLPIVRGAKELGIKVLTFYTFSTENWLRGAEEVDALMLLLESYLAEQREPMRLEGVRLHTIGAVDGLPAAVREALELTKLATAGGTHIDIVLALNYGGRNELCRAFRRLAADCVEGRCTAEQIDEKLIASYLDTAELCDPDLLIRTSGEHRLSNFLLWQMSYAEIVFSEVLWPDFTPLHLLEAVEHYQKRQRRGGA